jgi:hypothetical protein
MSTRQADRALLWRSCGIDAAGCGVAASIDPNMLRFSDNANRQVTVTMSVSPIRFARLLRCGTPLR